jgi:hypothetical protein
MQHLSPISPVQGPAGASSAAPVTRIGSAPGQGGSTINQLLNKLSALENTDPAAAADALSSISSQLGQLASQAGPDSRQGKLLTSMAADFSTAAQTGDLSALESKVQQHAHAVATLANGAQAQGAGPGGGGLQAYQQWQQLDTDAGVQGVLSHALQNLN